MRHHLAKALAVGAVLALVPAVAMAADELFEKKDCWPENGAVPIANDTVRDRLIKQAGIKLSMKTAQLLANGQLGSEAVSMAEDCSRRRPEEKQCDEEQNALVALFGYANDALSTKPGDEVRLVYANYGPTAPEDADLRIAAFLNGTADWVTFRCAKAIPKPPEEPPIPPRKPGLQVVIAKSEADASKGFAKREFASVALEHDGLENETAFTADIFIGVGKRDSASPLLGFVSYQRKSPSSEGNDLAFGVSYTTYFKGLTDGDTFSALGAWETDDRFRSSLWRAQVGWSPLLAVCDNRNIPGQLYLSCDATLILDYSDVVDPGRKEALQTRESFTRAGVDLRFEVWKGRGDKQGFYTFSTSYSRRHDLTDADADADLFTASLGIKTGDKSRFKVSLDYSEGRDLTSLEREETLKLSFGYRQ
mgnify:CR=1 FL=1